MQGHMHRELMAARHGGHHLRGGRATSSMSGTRRRRQRCPIACASCALGTGAPAPNTHRTHSSAAIAQAEAVADVVAASTDSALPRGRGGLQEGAVIVCRWLCQWKICTSTDVCQRWMQRCNGVLLALLAPPQCGSVHLSTHANCVRVPAGVCWHTLPLSFSLLWASRRVPRHCSHCSAVTAGASMCGYRSTGSCRAPPGRPLRRQRGVARCGQWSCVLATIF